MEILALQMDVKAVLWLALSPHSKEVRGSNPALAGASQCGVSMFSTRLIFFNVKGKCFKLKQVDKQRYMPWEIICKFNFAVNSSLKLNCWLPNAVNGHGSKLHLVCKFLKKNNNLLEKATQTGSAPNLILYNSKWIYFRQTQSRLEA